MLLLIYSGAVTRCYVTLFRRDEITRNMQVDTDWKMSDK